MATLHLAPADPRLLPAKLHTHHNRRRPLSLHVRESGKALSARASVPSSAPSSSPSSLSPRPLSLIKQTTAAPRQQTLHSHSHGQPACSTPPTHTTLTSPEDVPAAPAATNASISATGAAAAASSAAATAAAFLLAAPPAALAALDDGATSALVTWPLFLVLASAGPEELPAIDVDTATAAAADAATYADLLSSGEATPLQTLASLLLTGAITVLLLRSIRKRSERSKESRFRSSAVERLSPSSLSSLASKKVVEEAKEALAEASIAEPAAPKPTFLGTLGGAVVAGAMAYVGYVFVSGVDDSFASQPVSANYTVRNITITVRTIISGLGWLATFVFAFNSLGLTLLALQILFGLGNDDDKNSSGGAANSSSSSSAASEEGSDKSKPSSPSEGFSKK